jgi:NAD(P)-dependent dehydrogenase (short-subunit alcohol dehydrogenase family)
MSYELTESGVDRHMALNHFGHVLLTSHLLSLLKKTSEDHGTVRIVNLASNAHQGAPSDIKFESLEELNRDLGPNAQYGRSKLAIILYTRYFARHAAQGSAKVLMNASHPGFVSTRQSTEHIHEAYVAFNIPDAFTQLLIRATGIPSLDIWYPQCWNHSRRISSMAH